MGLEADLGSVCSEQANLFCLIRMLRIATNRESIRIFLFIGIHKI